VVFSGLFPTDTEQYPDLRDALLKLQVRLRSFQRTCRAELRWNNSSPAPALCIVTNAPEVKLT